jgi:hypothetical protein
MQPIMRADLTFNGKQREALEDSAVVNVPHRVLLARNGLAQQWVQLFRELTCDLGSRG